MSDYKKAAQMQLRFPTSKGYLSVEQAWSLSLTDLANAIKAVKKLLKGTSDDDSELSFLDENKVVDTENQLRFNILKDIYVTKQEENKKAKTATERKAFEQKILAIVAEKQEGALRDKSVEELLALLDGAEKNDK